MDAMEAPPETIPGRAQVGWGFWALWVLALAVVAALSYGVGSFAPLAKFTLPPAAMMIFGILAGSVQGVALRQQVPQAGRWFSASALAGFVAAWVSVLPTSLTTTSAGLLAAWAYAWAAYGAVLGVMLQRIFPGRWWMLTSLAGWAVAGMVGGAAGWFLDVFQVTATDPALSPLPATSRTWSMAGLALVGAVCGATGGAITGAALVLQSRRPLSRVSGAPQDRGASKAMSRRLTNTAGIVSGLTAAVLCAFVAPLVVTALIEGSLDRLDLTIFFLNAVYHSPVCIATNAVVAIPLGIGGARIGLGIGRAIGKPDSRLLIWVGAAVGGVVGYMLGSLLAFSLWGYEG